MTQVIRLLLVGLMCSQALTQPRSVKGSYSIGESGRATSGGGKLSLFNGKLRAEGLQVAFHADKVIGIYFHIGDNTWPAAKKASSADVAKLKAEVARRTGDASPKPHEHKYSDGKTLPGQQRLHREYKVQMFVALRFGTSSVTGMGVFYVSIVALTY